MTEREREKYLIDLDEELLKGSVTFSTWCHLLILESDTAFTNGAYLAAVLTAMAGMEAQLRFDHSEPKVHLTLAQLIETSTLPDGLKNEIHELRRFRNRWVHVADPWEESMIDRIEDPEIFRAEIEPWAVRAVTALRRAFYWYQGT